MDLINEDEKITYQVKLNGQVLNEAQSQSLAEQFVSTLAPEQQKAITIVPVTGGKQVLFG